MSIDYEGTIFAFTIYKDDVTRSRRTFYEEFNAETDTLTKEKIWMCISCNWLRYVYTEDEIASSALGNEGGKAEYVLQLAKKSCKHLFIDEYRIPYAAVSINEHLEVLPVRNRGGRYSHQLPQVYPQVDTPPISLISLWIF